VIKDETNTFYDHRRLPEIRWRNKSKMLVYLGIPGAEHADKPEAWREYSKEKYTVSRTTIDIDSLQLCLLRQCSLQAFSPLI
jgi:hypothetical protein